MFGYFVWQPFLPIILITYRNLISNYCSLTLHHLIAIALYFASDFSSMFDFQSKIITSSCSTFLCLNHIFPLFKF
ncbi:unnamed protein product [Schistosoma margrebowiei]|uniref:Uncharacterized protein n=1 Tax=Schistosoma margrebowiei TaxID=48269 RepID=A0A183LJ57_9TREM|nr:unnamed protein product [Schistosoma margrebowiei]